MWTEAISLAANFMNIQIVYEFIYLFASASYFALVATLAAFTGQHVVRKIIVVLGRASIIIFILALTIFISALSLGTFCDFN